MLLHFVELHILVLEAKPALEVEENEGKEKKTVKKKDKTNESKEKLKTGEHSCKCPGDVSPLFGMIRVKGYFLSHSPVPHL